MPPDFDDAIMLMVAGNMVSAAQLMRLSGRNELSAFPTPSPRRRRNGSHEDNAASSPSGGEIEMQFMQPAGEASRADPERSSPYTHAPNASNNYGGMSGRLSPKTPRGSMRRASAVV